MISKQIFALCCSILMCLFVTFISAHNHNNATVKVANDPKYGEILTDSRGMTLYIFTPDSENVSTCYDQCAIAWPPLMADREPILSPGVAGRLGVINRRDNTRQVTYNGRPLYYYIKDQKPGDTTGQNVDNQWYVVHPNKSNQYQNKPNQYQRQY
jgi:predicted lipoprotein with Yx(FWY)xxD motif